MGNVAKTKVENYSLEKSHETLELAIDLAKFIKELRLYQNIQGKEYVNVEGWQYAGARLGIVPVVNEVNDLSDNEQIKYGASVQLIQLASGTKVGTGYAICSNREQGKKYYQEFAICSMAQTRAIGKAYRNILAWVIKAAGYEPTPTEEMDYAGNDAVAEKPKTEKPKAEKRERPEPETKPTQPEAKPLNVKAEEPKEEGPGIKYASAKQKEEIIGLLNNPTITRQEKTKMLLNINRFDEERAGQAIEKLKAVIQEREDGKQYGPEAGNE